MLQPNSPEQRQEARHQSRVRDWWNRPATQKSLRRAALWAGYPLTAITTLLLLFYVHEARHIDESLAAGPFRDSVNIYAAPLTFSAGDGLTMTDAVSELADAGYQASSSAGPSTWKVMGSTLELNSPAGSDRKTIKIGFAKNQITWIRSGNESLQEFTIESPLIGSVSSENRQQSRFVTFTEIPPVLVNAVISAEDKHFFHHDGFDLPRIIKSAWDDAIERRKEEGASTLTMQLVRGLWLGRAKTWRRKVEEVTIAIHLESHWSKQQIFAAYANQVYLGRRAAWNVRGFAEGAHLYFGKNLQELSLAEAALLAGLVQRPSSDNPLRNPDRAVRRRNLVLALMRDNRFITPSEYEEATGEPLQVVETTNYGSAPWVLDLVNYELQKSEDGRHGTKNIRITLDLNLQRAAEAAMAAGLDEVDRQLEHRSSHPEKPQAALIALDPHTGEIKALVGGRDYGHSQLNHIFAERPPGSVFKPFVYAAALNTALIGANHIYTPATLVDDSPATFYSGGRAWQPSNFRHEFYGTMTLRQALARSDNTATVKVAEDVGLDSVVAMARRAGLNDKIRPTPAVALGAYNTTPLEIAAAYTAFANGGLWVKPRFVLAIGNGDGGPIHQDPPQTYRAMNPSLAWLMVSMLEEVMRSGTAAGVRARGFALPAAGKTGTSHDGWFAGFTTDLLCVVWVGFDDYSELGLEGARSALPIWAEFMKRATKFAAWKNAKEFPMPGGIERKDICLDDGKLAGDSCVNVRSEFFIEGSGPTEISQGPSALVPAADSSPGAGAAPSQPAVAPASTPSAEIETESPAASDGTRHVPEQ